MEGAPAWALTAGGVVRWNPAAGTYVQYSTDDGLADNSVYTIVIDTDGSKWFGTQGGVSVFDSSTWITYTEADGLASNHVSAIAIDGLGRKWFGTAFDGVSVFDGTTWTTYTYVYGDVVMLTATAHPNWTFAGWSGDVDSTANPLELTMEGDTTITATFEPREMKVYLPLVLTNH